MIYNIKLLILILISFTLVFSSTTFKLLSYNIYGLHPILLNSNFKKKNPKNRIETIFEESKFFDIILLQENWFYNDMIQRIMIDHQILISEKTNFFIKKNNYRSSGLNIALSNDFDIIHNEHILFSDCNGYLSNFNDCFASKGFIYTLISIDDYKINLYVTHLDAGYNIGDVRSREIQLKEISNHISNIKNKYPMIISGDFNINYYTHAEIIDNFVVKNNLNILRWDKKIETNEMIDYIFYKSGKKNSINILKFDINQKMIDRSDHLPIELYFNLIKNEL